MKTAVESNNRLDQAEGRIHEIEDRKFETIQSEENKRKRLQECMFYEIPSKGTTPDSLEF